jgi:hypothetical protein
MRPGGRLERFCSPGPSVIRHHAFVSTGVISRRDAALWLLVPWLVFVVSGTATPLYSDQPWRLGIALLFMIAGFGLLIVPSLFMILFVRTRVLFMLGVLTGSASSVFAVASMARSDETYRGLELLWAPYFWSIAAIALAILEFLHRRVR